MEAGKILKVSGPLITATNMENANMFEVVHVGKQKLIGEILEMRGDRASIQVYEDTAGIGPGDEVTTTGFPLSVELGPGMIGTVYDGIQRPLEAISELVGPCITRGIQVSPIDYTRLWQFHPIVKAGDRVTGGDIIGEVQETMIVRHKIMVPPNVSGTIKEIRAGEHRANDTVAVLTREDQTELPLTMTQRWPVRKGRPYKEKLPPDVPLNTGQRVIDTLFPLAKGGTAAIPGPFGSGKTVVQHQLAKWSDVDIVVYIGCGERGNEITDVLMEFPELVDPRTGESLMRRTVLIANTSDMPVAAREASIYTGITIAEYFRDMGYSVAVIADSTSRWAEALREMSGRLEEMPGEEGYPAYLASRLAQFYERAGNVRCLGTDQRLASLTAIGAVSPPGGDISEPVSQATLRIVKVFWGLDANLAYARHFPAINWLNSYSLYEDRLAGWFNENIHRDFIAQRAETMSLLQREGELEEIVRLVGVDALSPQDRLVLESARVIREDFLQQNAFVDLDAYTSFDKQFRLLNLIMEYHHQSAAALSAGADMNELFQIPVRGRISRAKDADQSEYKEIYAGIVEEMTAQIKSLEQAGGDIQ